MDLDELRRLMGTAAVVTDDEVNTGVVRDWTGRWSGSTPAVVYPESTAQVVDLVRWCRSQRVALVPQGGNTGMVGGGVPLEGEVVVKLTRMTGIEVDAAAGHLIAQAGATLAAVQDAAAAAGWRYGIDLGARDTATIGGTVATNAGGVDVIRYGDTRHQLLGIEAVTGEGSVVGDLRGLVKDNTGYHLPSLLAGSEGTLAVITRVCLRLQPRERETVVALLGFQSARLAVEAISVLRRSVSDLRSLEIFFADGIELVCSTFDLPRPLAAEAAAYLLIEAAGPIGVAERTAAGLEAVAVDPDDIAVAMDRGRQEQLWRYREAHTEAIATLGVPHKLDITVPLAEMLEFITDVPVVVRDHDPTLSTWLFGHAGDGNIHVNVTGADPDDHELDAKVLALVAQRGGSISAEHGVGRAKTTDLHLNRSADELDLYRRLKLAFDPDGILNPGVIIT